MEAYIIIGCIAAFTGVVAFLATIGRQVWSFLRQVAHFLADWFGEEGRPGVAARPGVMERLDSQDKVLSTHTQELRTISTRLVIVEGELKPNSGKSVKDTVNRIDQAIGGERTAGENENG